MCCIQDASVPVYVSKGPAAIEHECGVLPLYRCARSNPGEDILAKRREAVDQHWCRVALHQNYRVRQYGHVIGWVMWSWMLQGSMLEEMSVVVVVVLIYGLMCCRRPHHRQCQ